MKRPWRQLTRVLGRQRRASKLGKVPRRRPVAERLGWPGIALLALATGLVAFYPGLAPDRLEDLWRGTTPAPVEYASDRRAGTWLRAGERSRREGERGQSASLGLEGHVSHVRDGDTLEVAGVPIRIANLDCAELEASDGEAARRFMADLVRGQTVVCNLEGRRSFDREVGTCSLATSGEDLGEILIGEGVCSRW